MTIVLGIDTGGTCTDALLLKHDSGAVLAQAKALTARRDLATGIKEAVAAVANAVGAVVGGIVQQIQVTIHPLDGATRQFRVHLPDGVQDFGNLEAAVDHARQVAPPQLQKLARQAGAEQVEIEVIRRDNIAPIRAEWSGKLYLSTEIL